jgi:3-methylcrotonyl-CoA carboxylase alpha subunit
VTDHYLEVIK